MTPGVICVVSVRIYGGCLIAILVICSLISCRYAPSSEELRGPILRLQESAIDLGTIGDLAIVRGSFRLTNVGDMPCVIESLTSSCRCTAAEIGHPSILPGETITTDIIFDPMGRVGKIYESMYVNWEGPHGRQYLEIPVIGNVKQVLSIMPKTISIELSDDRVRASASIEIASVEEERFAVVRVDTPLFLEYEGEEMLESASHKLRFTTAPVAGMNLTEHREFRGIVTIVTTDLYQQNIELPAIVNYRPVFIVHPTTIVVREANLRDEYQVVVSRLDGVLFQIIDIDRGCAPVHVVYEAKPGARHVIRLRPIVEEVETGRSRNTFGIRIICQRNGVTDDVVVGLMVIGAERPDGASANSTD
jgi:hypothetical protein